MRGVVVGTAEGGSVGVGELGFELAVARWVTRARKSPVSTTTMLGHLVTFLCLKCSFSRCAALNRLCWALLLAHKISVRFRLSVSLLCVHYVVEHFG